MPLFTPHVNPFFHSRNTFRAKADPQREISFYVRRQEFVNNKNGAAWMQTTPPYAGCRRCRTPCPAARRAASAVSSRPALTRI